MVPSLDTAWTGFPLLKKQECVPPPCRGPGVREQGVGRVFLSEGCAHTLFRVFSTFYWRCTAPASTFARVCLLRTRTLYWMLLGPPGSLPSTPSLNRTCRVRGHDDGPQGLGGGRLWGAEFSLPHLRRFEGGE